MKVPRIRPEAFDKGFCLFQVKPTFLDEIDPRLSLYCDETSLRSERPRLMHVALRLAHHTLYSECFSRGITVPEVPPDVIPALTREVIEQGPAWDREMEWRLRKDYPTFHGVFEDWSRKKPRPALAFHATTRMFRIVELLLQPL